MQHYIRQTFGTSIKSRKVLKERETRVYKAEAIKTFLQKERKNGKQRGVESNKEEKEKTVENSKKKDSAGTGIPKVESRRIYKEAKRNTEKYRKHGAERR